MKRPIVWIVATLAGVVLLGMLLNARKPLPPSSREVPASELVVREGRSHWKDEAVPFTGFIVEHYPDDSLKSRSYLVDGRMHGVSEGWFTNGVLQVREHFREGVSHGLREKWHPNGAKLSETPIENGKVHGSFMRWHDNGALAERLRMHQGEPDGESIAFFPSGSVKARVLVKNGQVVRRETWKDGELSEPPAMN
jgi:antitoxin component YwqK of YwqJK toxin-antitoxin module